MKLNFDGLLALNGRLLADEFGSESEKIPGFLESFYKKDQGFLNLPEDETAQHACQDLAKKKSGMFKDIVILGIGGSALGITCLRDALKGPYWNLHGSPRCFVVDNLDLLEELEQCIELDKALFVVISKSGTTPETMAQYFYYKDKLRPDQWVFITDPSKGELRKIAGKEGIDCLEIPENVGGRFSVLSPVGLFPALLMDIDIKSLLQGAKQIAESFKSPDWEMNLPFQLATLIHTLMSQKEISQWVIMPYSSPLSSFADWCRQLIAESLGKNGKGITPIRSLGVTDQHSQVQLYNEGPSDKVINFIQLKNAVQREELIPSVDSEALSYLSGVSFQKLMATEANATAESLTEYGKAHFTIEIDSINARSLGQLLMLFQGATAFLGEFMMINAFDQPGVELAKIKTKEMLKASSS